MTNQTEIPGITANQLELALRLESIFMPQARRQRFQAGFGDDLGQEATRFVHYTSAEAALSIITSKRMWMRNTTCMADYREVQHGLAIIRNFFAEKANTESFLTALDACYPGIAQQALDIFKASGSTFYLSTYITSVSEHDKKEDRHGRLSMWRAFGGSNAARVAIVFRVPRFSGGTIALKIMFSPVAYLTEPEAHNVMHEVIQNISQSCDFLRSVDRQIILNTIFYMFLYTAVCLKHEGFREEREWRVIYSPTFNASPMIEASIEIVGGVPQLVYELPLDESVSPSLGDLDLSKMFDRLIIGPSSYPWVMYEAFVDALTKAGCPEAGNRVIISDIPIRA
jgi:DUF2971 family protein